MGEVSVVGDHQEPRSMVIEPSHGRELKVPDLGRDKVSYVLISLVFHGCEHFVGLIEEIVELILEPGIFALYTDAVGIGYMHGRVGNDFAVYRDLTFLYERTDVASRAVA